MRGKAITPAVCPSGAMSWYRPEIDAEDFSDLLLTEPSQLVRAKPRRRRGDHVA